MDQPLKQRLIGAIILISLAVIFVPMFIGNKPAETEIIPIEIPEPPQNLEPEILALPEQESEVLSEVIISKESGVKVTKPSIPEPPKSVPVKKIEGWVVLRKANFPAFVETIKGKKGDVYRVRVGPELSKEKADAINDQLRKTQKLPNAIVVKYP